MESYNRRKPTRSKGIKLIPSLLRNYNEIEKIITWRFLFSNHRLVKLQVWADESHNNGHSATRGYGKHRNVLFIFGRPTDTSKRHRWTECAFDGEQITKPSPLCAFAVRMPLSRF